MKGKKPITLRQPKVVLTKEPLPLVTTQPAPSVARKSVEHEDMEVGHITEAISEHLHIEDIDADDSENPQLCAAYVKEIYQYMTDLEVSLSGASAIVSPFFCPEHVLYCDFVSVNGILSTVLTRQCVGSFDRNFHLSTPTFIAKVPREPRLPTTAAKH